MLGVFWVALAADCCFGVGSVCLYIVVFFVCFLVVPAFSSGFNVVYSVFLVVSE